MFVHSEKLAYCDELEANQESLVTQLADMRQLLKRVALEGRERVAYELEKRVSVRTV